MRYLIRWTVITTAVKVGGDIKKEENHAITVLNLVLSIF